MLPVQIPRPLPARNRAILYLHDAHVPLKCISEDARCNIYGHVVSAWVCNSNVVERVLSDLVVAFVILELKKEFQIAESVNFRTFGIRNERPKN